MIDFRSLMCHKQMRDLFDTALWKIWMYPMTKSSGTCWFYAWRINDDPYTVGFEFDQFVVSPNYTQPQEYWWPEAALNDDELSTEFQRIIESVLGSGASCVTAAGKCEIAVTGHFAQNSTDIIEMVVAACEYETGLHFEEQWIDKS